jgi:ATP-dependent RNA helicase DDX27
VVKEVVRAARAQGAQVVSRVVDSHLADACMARVDALADEVEAILAMEKEERALGEAEREVRRGENLVGFEDEIKSRPKRTWFATGREKELARERGRQELNGPEAAATDKHFKRVAPHGKLSNKQKKSLDAKKEMQNGRAWKKGKGDSKGKAMMNGKGKGKGLGLGKGKGKGVGVGVGKEKRKGDEKTKAKMKKKKGGKEKKMNENVKVGRK